MGHAGDRAVLHQRHHGVAVSAQNERRHIPHGNAEFPGDEAAKPRGIQHTRHTDHPVLGEAGYLLERVDHGVQGVGHHHHECVGRIVADAGRHLLHDAKVLFEQIIARHSGLARQTGRDHHDIRARDIGVIVGATDTGIRTGERRAFRHVERLALRHPLDHVEEHHVAEFAVRGLLGQYATDIAATNQSDLLSHGGSLLLFFVFATR